MFESKIFSLSFLRLTLFTLSITKILVIEVSVGTPSTNKKTN